MRRADLQQDSHQSLAHAAASGLKMNAIVESDFGSDLVRSLPAGPLDHHLLGKS
jgi:hypothetical protein